MRCAVHVASFFLSCAVAAQNLVPNPSFEEYVLCPTNFSQIDQVLGWNSLYLSPDYYHECSEPSTGFDIPLNASGYQSAFEGSGYVGLITYDEIGAREYIQARLAAPLTPGQTTSISMRLSPGGFGITNWASPRYSCRGVGVRFSVTELPYGFQELVGAVVHLEHVLTDTLNWSVISTEYVPDSAYEYIQIGNFFDDLYSSPIVLDPLGDAPYGYAFVESVCVATEPKICEVATGLQQRSENVHPICASSVFTDYLSIDLSVVESRTYKLTLSNALGQVCFERTVDGGAGTLLVPTSTFCDGQFVLRLMAQDDLKFQRLWRVSN